MFFPTKKPLFTKSSHFFFLIFVFILVDLTNLPFFLSRIIKKPLSEIVIIKSFVIVGLILEFIFFLHLTDPVSKLTAKNSFLLFEK